MTHPAALIERIVQGDKNAERQLVENYYQGLLFILYRQTDSLSLAEDLTQDTFVVVLRKLRDGDLRNPDALSSFIRQTGINTLIAYRRLQTRRQTDVSDLTDTFAAQNPTLLHQLHERDASNLVLRVLNQLGTERDREILSRFYLHDEDKSKICDSLDLTPAHFDRVLFRARQRLRQLIEGDDEAASNVRQIIDGVIVLMLLAPVGGQNAFSPQFISFTEEVRVSVSHKHFNGQNGRIPQSGQKTDQAFYV